MNHVLNTLFGPLSSDYCYYFYYLSIICFVTFCFIGGAALFNLIKGKKEDFVKTILILLQPLVFYFINRLYFSMCVGALK